MSKLVQPKNSFREIVICLLIVFGSILLMGLICLFTHWSGIDQGISYPAIF